MRNAPTRSSSPDILRDVTTSEIERALLPRHVGVVMDGNRRWATLAGHTDPSVGHLFGADHVEDLLGWCDTWGIEHLTSYVLSADNIRKRPKEQVNALFGLLSERLPRIVMESERWALHVSGDVSLLPSATADALLSAERTTAGRPSHLTLAIGYDPHGDIVDGIRRALLAGGPDLSDHALGGPASVLPLLHRLHGSCTGSICAGPEL